jgi:hypothetical protein
MPSPKERSIITDKLVVEKTNKTMAEWFKVLDKHGAKKMKHAEIFKLVESIEELKPLGTWNQNLLTTSYEWDRGLKERGEKEGGIEISVSKTIDVPVSLLYHAWIEEHTRNKWLPEKNIIFRKVTENKSARITWSDNQTSLSVDFYPKSDTKSQVVVQHQKIATPDEAAKLKIYWADLLDQLKLLLEQ